jgi:hypothetical protein
MSDEFAEDDPAWMEACRREKVIRDLLRRYPGRMTRRRWRTWRGSLA